MITIDSKNGQIGFFINLYIKLVLLVAIFALFDSYIQFEYLIGTDGLSPVRDNIKNSFFEYGFWGVLRTPSLFWINSSDTFISFVFIIALLSALLALFNFYKSINLFILFFCWLSVINTGGDFFIYIWDTFLLESVFIAFLLAVIPENSKNIKLSKALLFFFIFRFWFTMGVEKILYNNPFWLDGTYMKFYFQNQPMPTKLSFYMSHFDPIIYTIIGAVVLVIELVLPLFIFTKKLRILAFVGFLFISILIQLFGNYAWFNILSVFVSVPLLMETSWGDAIFRYFSQQKAAKSGRYMVRFRRAVWIVYFQMFIQTTYLIFLFLPLGNRYLNFLNYYQYNPQFKQYSNANFLTRMISYPVYLAADFKIANPYGVFKGIPVKRWELEFRVLKSGEEDLRSEVKYFYKPGFVDGYNFFAPHFPRLEQQLFYEAQQGSFFINYTPTNQWKNSICWTDNLVRRLLRSGSLYSCSSEQGYQLIEVDIVQFSYHTWSEYKKDGNIWYKQSVFSFTLDKNNPTCPMIQPEIFTRFNKHVIH